MNASPRLRREAARFLKFSFVGVIGAIVDFGTFNLLTGFADVNSILASGLSFSAAITSNFLWNRYWTYPDSRSKPLRRQALQFAFVNLIGLAIRTPVFALSEGAFIRWAPSLPLPSAFDPIQVGRNLALALAVIVVLFWNFGVNRIWTYSDVS